MVEKKVTLKLWSFYWNGGKMRESPNPIQENPVPEIMDKKSTNILLKIGILIFGFLPQNSFADLNELIQQGDSALTTGNIKIAEQAFAKALELDPKNYRLLMFLGQIKFEKEQYAEAEKLVTRILAMPITRGRNVLVHLKGESEPLEAELVDETVMMIPENVDAAENDVAEKFLTGPVIDPIPHYRLFFKKAGKIKLVPKNNARIQYIGVPPRIHEKMVIRLAEIKKQIIAASGVGTDEVEMVELEGGCFIWGVREKKWTRNPCTKFASPPSRWINMKSPNPSIRPPWAGIPPGLLEPSFPWNGLTGPMPMSIAENSARDFPQKRSGNMPHAEGPKPSFILATK